MKSLLAIILIIGFAGVSIFGFMAIGHINQMAHNGCLAALAQNGVCPSASNAPLAAAFSHLNIIKSFSSVHLNSFFLLLILSICVGSLFGFVAISNLLVRPKEVMASLFRNLHEGINSISLNFDWLVIHFNSPSFVLSA